MINGISLFLALQNIHITETWGLIRRLKRKVFIVPTTDDWLKKELWDIGIMAKMVKPDEWFRKMMINYNRPERITQTDIWRAKAEGKEIQAEGIMFFSHAQDP